MQRFRNILFVLGETSLTRDAYTKTAALAARNEAELTVMDVVESVPSRRRTFTTANAVYDLEELLIADSVKRINDLLEHAKDASHATPEIVVATGRRPTEVILRILAAEHDLVIIPDAEDGYNTTTHNLLRKAPCPLWVMTSSIQGEQRILAAVDPDPTEPTQQHLSDDVLSLAASLALHEGAPLHIVHAWSVPRGGGFGLSVSDLDAIREETMSLQRDDLDALLKRHQLPPHTTVHYLEGNPAKVIRMVTARHHITTIVLGTVSRAGIAGLIIGNTSETILRHVGCSVLAVKPQGFKTPVSPT